MKGMLRFEWLKIEEGKTTGNPQRIISNWFHKKRMQNSYLFCRCQKDFRVSYADCGFDHCKAAKNSVGTFLAI